MGVHDGQTVEHVEYIAVFAVGENLDDVFEVLADGVGCGIFLSAYVVCGHVGYVTEDVGARECGVVAACTL